MAKNVSEIIREIAMGIMPSIMTGVVVETEPLCIMLTDDFNIKLSNQSLIIPSGKRPFAKNEQLYLLAVNNNKIYYVLDRV